MYLIFLSFIACSSSGKTDNESNDYDGDGFFAGVDDCDDHNPLVYNGAAEYCDGFDNNCNGEVDEDESFFLEFFVDSDGDAFGLTTSSIRSCTSPDGYVTEAGDCDDNNASVFPNAEETCDGLDNNCNEEIDESAVDATDWTMTEMGLGILYFPFEVAPIPNTMSKMQLTVKI